LETFTVASNEFLGGGKEKAEYSPIVTWDRLAEIAGRYLGKGQQVAIEGRLQTRSWDDEKGAVQNQLWYPDAIHCEELPSASLVSPGPEHHQGDDRQDE
jgi:single stranded DNA-binding protein